MYYIIISLKINKFLSHRKILFYIFRLTFSPFKAIFQYLSKKIPFLDHRKLGVSA
jgi:hypothetical protein